MYDASCFIKSISYSCNSYKISYNILELFKVKEDSKVGHSNLRWKKKNEVGMFGMSLTKIVKKKKLGWK